jgi:4-amino-4-deoxy-L-arabinose transferase-like glycosyltransferase
MTLRFWLALLFLAVLLLSIELFFLPRAGIQADEVLFVTPFFKGATPLYSWQVEAARIPVMIMDYIGALKSWLYWPIFQVWPASVWSIRLPACLVSVATLIIFGDLVRRVAGVGAALWAAVFLATDATFTLTNVYDWGPVALLLLATVSFMNLVNRYAESNRIVYLGCAFSIAGLATWYKAIFVFPLAGIGLAFLVAYFPDVRRRFSLRNAAVAGIFFTAGAAPLIAFNLAHSGATLAATTYIGNGSGAEKALMMRRTLEGRALEHYIFRAYPREKISLNGAPPADLAATWYRSSQLGPGSALPWLLLLSLIALPFLRRSGQFRPLLFAWTACAAVFGLMLVFRDAGAGPHHTVLIDPGPQLIVAITLSAIGGIIPRRRWLACAAGAVLIASNFYLLARYYAEGRRNGFSVYWTDGERSLTRVIRAQSLPVAFIDWGIRDVVRVESGDTVALAPDEEPREGVLYVEHCEGYVIDAAQTGSFEQKLARSNLHRTEVQRVSDPHGEPVFCLAVLGK